MNTRTLLFATAFALIPLLSAQLPPRSSAKFDALYRDAQASYRKGDYETAMDRLGLCLEMQPHHRAARSMLAESSRRIRNAGGSLKRAAAKVVIPEIAFEESTVAEAVDFLRIQTSAVTKGKFTPNLIIHGYSADPKVGQTFTLNLRNVPLSDVLRYMAELTGGTVQYEKNAIFLRAPKQAKTAANPAKAARHE